MFSMTDYRVALRHDFVSFIHRAFLELNPSTKLLLAPYIALIADRLEQCRSGKIKRLIINLPPRYLKSHCASVSFVAWLLGHRPSAQIICASYGQDLADKLALDCRKLMEAAWYQEIFATRLAFDKRRIDDFNTINEGSRMSTSVGGVLTGRGADFIIIDDPLKPDDGLSETKRKSVNDWYDSTLLSRLNNKNTGCIILIMQRLHQDDLVGHVLPQDDWTVLNLPAITDTDERYFFDTLVGPATYLRSAGEALHAERETVAQLQATRARIGEYHYSCQYQQQPIPVGGAMVKSQWIMTYDELPPKHEIQWILQSWDTAVKAGELNDFSVCTTWAMVKGRYYLFNVFRKRLEYPDLKRAVIELSQQYRPNTILIEDKASGSALIQELRGQIHGRIMAYELPPNKDKLMRLFAQTDLFENGQIYVPNQAPWVLDYRLELTSFPGSKYDDQVDSTTQALDHWRSRGSKLAIWENLGRG
jgi:predicted phage terminase large subunit-like protein